LKGDFPIRNIKEEWHFLLPHFMGQVSVPKIYEKGRSTTRIVLHEIEEKL
jgi:hypothetical protein